MYHTMRRKHNRNGGINSLKICHWNVEGMRSQVLGNKSEDKVFMSKVRNYDVIGLTETHDMGDTLIQIPGFKTYKSVRPINPKAKKGSGGVAVLIKDCLLPRTRYLKSQSSDIMWLEVRGHIMAEVLYTAIVYLSPSN